VTARKEAAAAATERLGTAVLGEGLVRVGPRAEVDDADGLTRRALGLSVAGAIGYGEVTDDVEATEGVEG